MKKMLIFVFSGSLMLTVITSKVNAQSSLFAANREVTVFNIAEPQKNETSLKSEEVDSKALNDFLKKYKNSSDVIWTVNDQQLTVYFTKDDIKMRSIYNEKGKWEYTVSNYNESKLPESIRKDVKSSYYDMNIMWVTKIELHASTTYFVKMEDEKTCLTVKVNDSEMEEFEKFNKK